MGLPPSLTYIDHNGNFRRVAGRTPANEVWQHHFNIVLDELRSRHEEFGTLRGIPLDEGQLSLVEAFDVADLGADGAGVAVAYPLVGVGGPAENAGGDSSPTPGDAESVPIGIKLKRRRVELFDWATSALMRIFTLCIPDEVLEDIEDDREVVSRVRDEMLVVKESGRPVEHEAKIALNPPEVVNYDENNQLCSISPHMREAAIQPRFIVQVVVALRCKLGLGAKDKSVPGNVELVRREAAKLMRTWGVRDTDASIHLRYVERMFFEEGTHDRLPEWRARAATRGKLLTWLFKREQPKYNF